MKKGWKIVLFAGLGFLLFFFLSIGFTQTKIFRNWLRGYLLANVQQNTNATLYLGDFSGSLFTGLTVTGVSLTLDGVELFTAEIVELRYNPLELLQKHIALGQFAVSRPKVSIRRYRDGTWNLQRLLKTRADTGRAPSRFPWKIELKSFEIFGGELSILDSSDTETYEKSVDDTTQSRNPYRQVVLRNINARLVAEISAGDVQVTIDRLNLESPTFGTRVERLSAGLQYAKQKIQLKNLSLVTTASALTANAEVDGLDLGKPLSPQAIRNHRAHLDLDASHISLDELENFLPGSTTLSGAISLKTTVDGTLGELRLQQLILKTEESELKLAGLLHEILDPKKRSFDLTIHASSAELPQLHTYLPSLDPSRITRFKEIELNGYFKGGLKNFDANIKANFKDQGRFEVTGHLDRRESIPQYQAKFVTNDLQIGPLLETQEKSSKLNVSGEISGKGFRMKDLELTASATVDSSQLADLRIGKSTASITASGQRVDGNLSAQFDGAAIHLRGAVDFRDEAFPGYDISGEFAALDFSTLFPEKDYRSDFNGSFTLNGSGRDFDQMSGKFNLQFGESSFRGHKFEGPGLKLVMDQHRHQKKTIVLESPVFDARVEGDFHLKPFSSLVKYQVGNVLRSLKERLPFIDTNRVASVGVKPASRSGVLLTSRPLEREHFDFAYDVSVKNLIPLAVFLGKEDFNAKANVTGFVVGDASDLLLGATALVDNFVYRGRKTKALLTKAKVSIEFDHLKQENVLDAMKGKIDATASRWFMNGLRMTNFNASVDYLAGQGSFNVRGVIDSTLSVETNGAVTVTSGGYTCKLENFSIDYRGYYWDNRTPILATIDTSGLMIKEAELRHRGERVLLSGGIRPNRDLALDFKVQDYQLSNLHYFLRGEEQRKLSGLGSLEGALAGPLTDPRFTLRTSAANIKYGAVAFGTLQADVNYTERKAALNIELRSSSNQEKPPDLLITGSLPIDLAFTSVEDRFHEGTLDLQVQATAFHLDLLDPFIPVFDQIEGSLFADVRLGGTTKHPLWWGSMRLEDGKFVFGPNGLRYFVSGSFQPKEEKIFISKLIFRNDPKDEEAKGLTVTGELTIKPLYIESFDLSGKGQLLILKETVRKSRTIPYGNLLVAIGPSGLRYSGTWEQSFLNGAVLVKTMSVTFPPVTLLPTISPTRSYTYVVLDDTSRPVLRQESSDTLAQELLLIEENKNQRETAARNRPNTFEKLLAGMRADVSIETDGPAQLRMVFTYSTGEELFSELRGKLLFVKDEFGTRFTGDVEAAQRSYYYFYKRFDATGKLKFAGPITNPEMDITAKYEGFRTRPPTDTLGISSAGSEKEQRVVVTLKITGTRITPKLSVEMTVGGTEWPGDVQSDAIAFIVSGKFRDDLTTPERNQVYTGLGTSVTSTLITGVTASLFSGVLTDFLRRELGGFVRQAELSYSGGSVHESADLRVTGEIGQTVIRAGGRVFSDIGNANVSVQMPVGPILGIPALEDLIIELERKVEGSSYATDEKKLTNGARIYYRIAF